MYTIHTFVKVIILQEKILNKHKDFQLILII